MFSVLKYERCRELFSTDFNNIKEKDKSKNMYTSITNFEYLNEFMFRNNIKYNIENLKKYTNPYEICFLEE